MGIKKIPFAWHPEEGKWKDPGTVFRGLACGCICHECGKPLQAVHPKTKRIQKYFRHAKVSDCTGALESLFHKMGKDVLATNSVLFVSETEQFFYDNCVIEKRRYGKQPDSYLVNSKTGKSIAVEIFYCHRIEESTLRAFQDKGERVLEIDISALQKVFYSLGEFEELILKKAPRQFLFLPESTCLRPIYSDGQSSSTRQLSNWLAKNWQWILAAVVLLGYWLYRKSRSKTI